MTQQQSLPVFEPALEIAVECVGDQKVFQLYGLRFSVLPAEIITGRLPFGSLMHVVRKDGSKLLGRVYRPDDSPRGETGAAASFIMRGLGLADIGPLTLKAESFEEGDTLQVERVPWSFQVDLLDNLEMYFNCHRDFHARYKNIRKKYAHDLKDPKTGQYLETEAGDAVMRNFLVQMFSLLVELKDLPHWPAAISLEKEETKGA